MSLQCRRILFVVPSLEGGGAERVTLTLLRHLDRARFEPHLATVSAAGPFSKFLPADIPLYDLRARRARYSMPALVRLVRKLRPDVVFSTLGYLNLLLLLARPLLPRKVKVLVREAITVSAELAHDLRYPRMWAWLYRHWYKKADRVICQCDYMLDDLAKQFGVPRKKLLRIYNPIDTQRIKECASQCENHYAGVGPHLVSAGRLSHQKGFDVLLDAMAIICRTFPQATLTILGEGPLEAALQAQRDSLGLSTAVRCVGFQANPYPYFKYARVFVLASRYEGLPNAVLEALALGTPVVATDCPGGLREILEAHPQLRLVEVDNPVGLAEAVIDVLRNETCASSEVLPSRFIERFGVENVVTEYERVLESV